MTNKKRYVTEEEFDKFNVETGRLLIVVLVVSIFFGAIIGAIFVNFSPREQSQEAFRSFELEKYNFTDSECADFQFDFADNIPLMCKDFLVIGKSWFSIPDICKEYGKQTCTLYCHTKQVPTGEEECHNVTRLKVQATYPGVSCWEDIRAEGGIRCQPDFGGIKYEYGEPFNETVCTPTYRNITYGCQSGDDVRKARELRK